MPIGSRFIRPGIEKVYFVPTLTAQGAPTVAQITAGTSLTGVIRTVTGWTTTAEDIEVADLSSRFKPTVPGMQAVNKSSLQLYRSLVSTDAEEAARAVLAEQAKGYIVFFINADGSPTPVPGGKADVWPVAVRANNDEKSAGNNGATWMVEFSVPALPSKSVAIS